jgi:hypothetical protein
MKTRINRAANLQYRASVVTRVAPGPQLFPGNRLNAALMVQRFSKRFALPFAHLLCTAKWMFAEPISRLAPWVGAVRILLTGQG